MTAALARRRAAALLPRAGADAVPMPRPSRRAPSDCLAPGTGDLAEARPRQPCRSAAATTTWTPTRSAPAPRPSSPTSMRLADAGARGCGMGRLRIIGLEAEAAMLAATSGVNTHRGAIFGLGLLCAAAGARAGGLVDPGLPLGDVVARLWGASILDGPVLLHSHGSDGSPPLSAPAVRAWRPPRDFPASTRSACPPCGGGARQRSRRCGSRARRSMLRAHRRARGHQPAASRRPARAFALRAARPGASSTRAASAGPAGASARDRSTRASSPAVSARAGRPIFLP